MVSRAALPKRQHESRWPHGLPDDSCESRRPGRTESLGRSMVRPASDTELTSLGGSMTELTHRLVMTRAGRIHLVEQGSGPLVLLVHGFPESWYSWRHQLSALAAAGYRAVAVDVRGFGRCSTPADIAASRRVD